MNTPSDGIGWPDAMVAGAASSRQMDYLPNDEEFDDYEDLFGAFLVAGHTVGQAATFLIQLGNGVVT